MELHNVWRLISHHIITDKDAALRWSVKTEHICVGSGTIGDMRAHDYTSLDQIVDAIRIQFQRGNTSTPTTKIAQTVYGRFTTR